MVSTLEEIEVYADACEAEGRPFDLVIDGTTFGIVELDLAGDGWITFYSGPGGTGYGDGFNFGEVRVSNGVGAGHGNSTTGDGIGETRTPTGARHDSGR